MSTPSIRKRFVVWPWGLAFAVVWLFVFERMVARRGWVWDFNEYSSTGTITALERRIIAKAPAPKIVLLGNSRMRDAIAPRQLEDELGCAKGTVMNLAVSAGGTFEAKALYERNKKKLSRADVVVLNVDTWYLDETEPPTMNVRRFGALSDRVGIYGWRETASLVVGWAWRSYDVRERYDGLLTAWLEDKKSSHLKILPDGRVHFRKNSGEDGPQRIRPDMTGLEKLVFGGGREDELARFVAEVSASGPRVLLVALPLRDEYVDAAEREFPAKLDEFERRIASIPGADFEHHRRGTELGIPKTGFYDYGHMAPSGTKLMTSAFADLVREKYGTCAPSE